MINEEQVSDIWMLFKEYIDKKQLEIVAEKYVDMLADYGVSDLDFKGALGTEKYLDSAIQYYLELDEEDNDNEDEYED
jgi:hypothetical protein